MQEAGVSNHTNGESQQDGDKFDANGSIRNGPRSAKRMNSSNLGTPRSGASRRSFGDRISGSRRSLDGVSERDPTSSWRSTGSKRKRRQVGNSPCLGSCQKLRTALKHWLARGSPDQTEECSCLACSANALPCFLSLHRKGALWLLGSCKEGF